ncbi:hypothetical protein HanPI659440_Chr13g0494021 [Helianthus annuus]|nr:hypothetical protein HanPI659440_Chr13g0494021 [Helianthus annuus]
MQTGDGHVFLIFFSEIAIRMTYLYFILFPNNINFLLIQVMLSLPCSNDCRHTLIAATSPLISVCFFIPNCVVLNIYDNFILWSD